MATHSAIGCHSNATESYLYVLNSLAGTSSARVADALNLTHNCACFKAAGPSRGQSQSTTSPIAFLSASAQSKYLNILFRFRLRSDISFSLSRSHL
ncbi:hypothetical protein PGTUg99_004984 [Puccinia graminis f. sp. tritici]|uniref:Uncharacterized protein n=1 Tax=Puccinia graminis f. sp. tritici TaxID=56615 RepID=A0A5B0QYN4_PUCGR|nr:hypothetical protein PGTUg99_004984 [Puccinia graminis f. sp. tritici]